MHKLHKLSGMAPNSATCEKMRCVPQKNEKPESEIDGSRSLSSTTNPLLVGGCAKSSDKKKHTLGQILEKRQQPVRAIS